MKLRHLKLFLVAGLLFESTAFGSLSGAFAQTTTPSVTSKLEQRLEAQITKTAERQSTELARLQERADTMITDRINSLNKLLSRVQSDKRLSDADKASLENDINTTITSLNTLKAKIDADTDVTTARTDTKSIVTSYRIYMIFEPKVRLLVTLDNLQTEMANVSSLSAKVQNLLNTLNSQGKDVTTAQTLVTDINTKITDIQSKLAADKTLVSNVTVSTTDPQSVFVQVRKDLAGVRAEVAQIRNDFAQLRSFFHINSAKGTVTGQPTSTPSATPTP